MQSIISGTLISSVHGRDRRQERKIGKHDLLAAVKYGMKERGHTSHNGEQRWKYTFANIVYITDETSRQEITSYVLPFEIHTIPVSLEDIQVHKQLKLDLMANPRKCSHHYVIVVDQSGSMRTCDVPNYKTRSDAVYGTMALDFIGKHIDTGQASGTEVVTLIEMKDKSTLIFDREPLTNVLFNKFVEQKMNASPSSHGNYIPALEAISEALEPDIDNYSCNLSVMFLTDGKPSDLIRGFGEAEVEDRIIDDTSALCMQFGKHLTFGIIGFGGESCDFTLCKRMINVSNVCGCKGMFERTKLSSEALSVSVSNIGSHLSSTQTRMSVFNEGGEGSNIIAPTKYSIRSVEREVPDLDVSKLSPKGWTIYTAHASRATWSNATKSWILRQPLTSPNAIGVAVRKRIFGSGSERIVYQISEVMAKPSDPNSLFLCGELLVAKECRRIEDEAKKMKFHELFCTTQHKAGDFATDFNARMRIAYPNCKPAQIIFLDCYVYEIANDIDPNFLRGLLVEKMLDPKKYKKWNGNDGSVMNGGENDTVADLFPSHQQQLSSNAGSSRRVVSFAIPDSESESEAVDIPADDEIPQAFSHFTYRHSMRKMLVCDLQGVLDTSVRPHVFQLTDPVIHSGGEENRKGKFGRTDRGGTGIHDFFKSHKCNKVCKKLGLPSDN